MLKVKKQFIFLYRAFLFLKCLCIYIFFVQKKSLPQDNLCSQLQNVFLKTDKKGKLFTMEKIKNKRKCKFVLKFLRKKWLDHFLV